MRSPPSKRFEHLRDAITFRIFLSVILANLMTCAEECDSCIHQKLHGESAEYFDSCIHQKLHPPQSLYMSRYTTGACLWRIGEPETAASK